LIACIGRPLQENALLLGEFQYPARFMRRLR
jgi:hypothetical protein